MEKPSQVSDAHEDMNVLLKSDNRGGAKVPKC